MAFYFSAFLSAFLLFLIQPLIARAILPYFGGIPAVWVTTMMSFQILLLVGYFYSYKIVNLSKYHLLIHAALIALSLSLLPINIEIGEQVNLAENSALVVLEIIMRSVGIFFLMLSTNTILLQYWYKASWKNKNPYPMYAASNLGSVLGLLTFPLIFENYLTLPEQQNVFSFGYIAYALLTILLIIFVWKKYDKPSVAAKKKVEKVEHKTSLKEKLYWVFLAFVPSSLMLSFTTYFTTDVAAIPLFWIIPLSIYLLTFIFAFSEFSIKAKLVSFAALSFEMLLILLLTFFSLVWLGFAMAGAFITISIAGILFFFTASFLCHARLYDAKPPAQNLGNFYILIALGGALGGIFNSILAPLIFNGIYEFYITGLLSCFLLSKIKLPAKTILLPPITLLLLLAVMLTFSYFLPEENIEILANILAAILIIALFKLRKNSTYFLATILLTITMYVVCTPKLYVLKERNFFGGVEIQNKGDRMIMIHGNTLHGVQYFDPELKMVPTTYYKTPVDHILSALPSNAQKGDFAVIGLGVGTLACQASKSQNMDMYEIDQKIVDIASNPKYFSYLQDCLGNYKTYVGDGRLMLKQNADKRYSLIFFDAYNSDSIPTHLLTKEAIELYIARSTDEPVFAFHISNRYIDLLPLLAKLAEEKEMMISYYRTKDSEISKTETVSVWAVMSRSDSKMHEYLSEKFGWQVPTEKLERAWTDDYVNILPLLTFFKKSSQQ